MDMTVNTLPFPLTTGVPFLQSASFVQLVLGIVGSYKDEENQKGEETLAIPELVLYIAELGDTNEHWDRS